jgi:hypothetical protein
MGEIVVAIPNAAGGAVTQLQRPKVLVVSQFEFASGSLAFGHSAALSSLYLGMRLPFQLAS